jgi:hypothetical protein
MKRHHAAELLACYNVNILKTARRARDFIASDTTFIRDFTFQCYTDGRVPENLKIKYVIEEP